MKSRKHKHVTTKNNQNGSKKMHDYISDVFNAKGIKTVIRTEAEPATEPIMITFCYKTNTVVYEGAIFNEMGGYYNLMKGKETLMLDQVENWNKYFSSMTEEIKFMWCMNIYCLTKVGIIINDQWNGVEYLSAG